MSQKKKEGFIDDYFKSELLFETTWKIARAFKIFLMLVIFNTFFIFLFIPSYSMSPTTVKGDVVFIKLGNSNIKRGDIISFISPYNKNELYVKRVIGLPGEKIEVRDCRVYINSELLEESYVSSYPIYCKDQLLVVPEGEYYALGDNRWDSIDSMEFGTIKKEVIKGKIIKIFSLRNLSEFIEERLK